MNTCDTCRHWDSEYRECEHPKLGGLDDGIETDCARHQYEDVPIMTGPKFGCIHWEPKGIQA